MLSCKEYLDKNYNIVCKVTPVNFNFKKGSFGIKAIKYQVGKKNQVFAFYGKPSEIKPTSGYPAVLLIHGGMGYAYYEWVRKWTNRGYVAIAPDYDAQIAIDDEHRQVVNPVGGPKGYGSVYETESDDPWIYFSILSSIKAIDILCEDKDVDKNKIVLDSISWGGFVGMKLLSIDKRIKAATIKYSAAYISETTWGQDEGLKKLTNQQIYIYNRFFDPQNDLHNIKTPILFAAGTDDRCFMMNTRKKTSDAVGSQIKAFGYRLHYDHGHFEGWKTSEAIDFADSILNGNEIVNLNFEISSNGNIMIKGNENISDITLCYTICDFYKTEKCDWAEVVIDNNFVLPENVSAYFITYIVDNKTHYSTDVFVKQFNK